MRMMSGYLFGMCIKGKEIAHALLSETSGFPSLSAVSQWVFGGQDNLPELQLSLERGEQTL